MSDALPLPLRPNLEQYRKLAREFQHVCRSGEAGALRDWTAHWLETLAHLHGSAITAGVQSETERIGQQWRTLQKSSEPAARCTLAGAQFFLARCHGFASWPKFARFLQAAERPDSPVSLFESAVDAIVGGDVEALKKLLAANPDLVRMRSAREHHSTLLHYVSANGVEDFRQKTPGNIVAIAAALLEAGADVNAESRAYGGGWTALGLAATSVHPENAGVQIALMKLLLERGAAIDGPDGRSAVNACLHNGRGEAAEFLAGHGARLNLEGAAGVGRLDLVQTYFGEDGRLKPPCADRQMRDAFAWACQFGRTRVVEFLLLRGMEVDARLKHHGQTGLHWAAYGGHDETVGLLLRHAAPVDARDESFEDTPLGWALSAWGHSRRTPQGGRYYETVALLVRAGATVDRQRLEGVPKLRSDPHMQAALRGELPPNPG